MGRDSMAGQDEDSLLGSKHVGERSRRCTSSEQIVQYFLDDLSSARRKDLTDHLSACDLCSARLLALEISAAVSLENLPAASRSTVAGLGRDADCHSRAANKPTVRRTDRRRARRTAGITVTTLDDRELLTAIALPVDFGAVASVARFEPLEIAVPRLSLDARRNDQRGGTAGGLTDPRLWDLAISELFGTTSFRPVLTSVEHHAAA